MAKPFEFTLIIIMACEIFDVFMQSISVSVSVLTLTCISIDRWYAICKPLEFSSTKSRAKNIIILIWIVSMIIASPDAIFLTTKPLYEEDGYVYMDCTYSWPEENTKIYQLCIVTLLFVFPFILMTISYSHIVNVLWRNETMTESIQHSIQLEGQLQQKKYNVVQMTDTRSNQSKASDARVDNTQDHKINIYHENSSQQPEQIHDRQSNSSNLSDETCCITANDIISGCEMRESSGNKVSFEYSNYCPSNSSKNAIEDGARCQNRFDNQPSSFQYKLNHSVVSMLKSSDDKDGEKFEAYRGNLSSSSSFVDGELAASKRRRLGSHYFLSHRAVRKNEIESPPLLSQNSPLNCYVNDYHQDHHHGHCFRESQAESDDNFKYCNRDEATKKTSRPRLHSADSILIRSPEKLNNYNSNSSCASSSDKDSTQTIAVRGGVNVKKLDIAKTSDDGTLGGISATAARLGNQNEPYIITCNDNDSKDKNNSLAAKNVPSNGRLEIIRKLSAETDQTKTGCCLSDMNAGKDVLLERAANNHLKVANSKPTCELGILDTAQSDLDRVTFVPGSCQQSRTTQLSRRLSLEGILLVNKSANGIDMDDRNKRSVWLARDGANKIQFVHVQARERADSMKKIPLSTPTPSVEKALTLAPFNEEAIERHKGMILMELSDESAADRLTCLFNGDNHRYEAGQQSENSEITVVASVDVGDENDNDIKMVGHERRAFQSYVKPPCSEGMPLKVIGLLRYDKRHRGCEAKKTRDLIEQHRAKALAGANKNQTTRQHLKRVWGMTRGSEPMSLTRTGDDTIKLSVQDRLTQKISQKTSNSMLDRESLMQTGGSICGSCQQLKVNSKNRTVISKPSATIKGFNSFENGELFKKMKNATNSGKKRRTGIVKKISKDTSASLRTLDGKKTKTCTQNELGSCKQSIISSHSESDSSSMLVIAINVPNGLNSCDFCKCFPRFTPKSLQNHNRSIVIERCSKNRYRKKNQATSNEKASHSMRSNQGDCIAENHSLESCIKLKEKSANNWHDPCWVSRNKDLAKKFQVHSISRQYHMTTHWNSNSSINQRLCNGELRETQPQNTLSIEGKLVRDDQLSSMRSNCRNQHTEHYDDNINYGVANSECKVRSRLGGNQVGLKQNMFSGNIIETKLKASNCTDNNDILSNPNEDFRSAKTTLGSITSQVVIPSHESLLETSQHNQSSRFTASSTSSNARFYKLIESRKKAAKMLIVIVIMFGLCYVPIHFLNLLRYTIGLPQNDITTIASLVSHWLCYFNSAVNPLIYNLMSGALDEPRPTLANGRKQASGYD